MAGVSAKPPTVKCKQVTLNNQFLKVYVDLCTGVAAVLNVATGTNYSLTHELLRWKVSNNDAYAS